MKVDGGIGSNLDKAASSAKEAEDDGYDGAWTAETSHDPFFAAAGRRAHRADRARHGHRRRLRPQPDDPGPHRPTTCRRFSEGRFILGLGSQIKPHIEKRFSMPWSQPAARMREFILAMRAIWASWNDGTKLDFRGDFYTHTLMTPFFNPGPNPYGTAEGVPGRRRRADDRGRRRGRATGSSATASPPSGTCARSRCPALERGRAKAGKHARRLRDLRPELRRHRHQRGGDGRGRHGRPRSRSPSTARRPPTAGVLELHGWGDLQAELNALSKQGEWEEMGELIDDEMLDAFAVVAEPEGIAAELTERYGDFVDRLSFYAPVQERPRALGSRAATSRPSEPVASGASDPSEGCGAPAGGLGRPSQTRTSSRGSGRGTATAGACPTRSWASVPGCDEHDLLGREADRLAHAARRPIGASDVGMSARLASATTTMPSLPCRPSTPKAMTLPARTPSTSPAARSTSSGKTLRPPTMITSLMRPHTTSSPSSEVGEVAGAQPAVVGTARAVASGRR